MKPLKEQILASNPAKSVWLTANAGTGKTFVLVNRLLRLIIDGNPPARILCITYTKAAAAEMQSRIIRTISDLILLDDSELKTELAGRYDEEFEHGNILKIRKRMADILENPEQLNINTIHAFCQRVLKSFPLEAGIPPFFSVIDETSAQQLLSEAWNRLICKATDLTHEKISVLLSVFPLNTIKKTFNELINDRSRLLAEIAKHGGVNEYIGFIKTILEIENVSIIEMEKEFRLDAMGFFRDLSEVLAKGKKTEQNILDDINLYFTSRNVEDAESVFFTEKGDLRSYFTKNLAKDYPLLATQTIYYAEKLQQLINKIKDAELFRITEAVLVIFSEYNKLFEDIKKQSYTLDYDDLIKTTTALFSTGNPHSQWVLYKLEGGIDHLLLDEAQDTNPAQWQVIDAITSEFFSGQGIKENSNRSLFVVGDEKQSIYSFQGADISIFNEKKVYYTSRSAGDFISLSLGKSFRSANAVLTLVDKVLADDNVKKSVSKSNIDIKHELTRNSFGYFEIEELCGNEPARNNSKEQIKWELPKEYIKEEEQKNREILAERLAEKIDAILNRPYPLASTHKKPEPGDILILLRKRQGLFDLIIQKLQQKNIPVSGMDRLNLKDNIIIKDLIAVGKFVLLTNDDLNLACVLKSPVFELGQKELFELCWNRGSKSIYDNIKDKAQDSQKFSEIINTLDKIRQLPDSLFEFYFHILEVLDFRKNFIAYEGQQINEILDEFLSAVKSYEASNGKGLQQFIIWFENNDIEIKRNLSSRQGEVRIMTVHGAKGLESPIIFLPDTTGYRKNPLKYGYSDIGAFLCPIRSEYNNRLFGEVTDYNFRREIEEYHRLLYVAMTRARDELYVMGMKASGSGVDTWHNIVWKAALEVCEKYDDKLVYSKDELIEKKPAPESREKMLQVDFSFEPYKEKKVEVITPSALYRTENENQLVINNSDFARGLAIHRLLEVIPDSVNSFQKTADTIFKYYPQFDETARRSIISEVEKVLNNEDFRFIFGNNSKAEVPICGFDDGRFISGKIDRLIVNEKDIIIIDYKTNNIAESRISSVTEKYAPQLNAYKSLLGKIYPDREIRAALLFTAINRLEYL